MGAKAGQRRDRAAGRQRVALILFGTLLFVLFIGFAVGQGLGSPSVPSGDVALVEDVPDDLGKISREEYDRAFARQLAEAKTEGKLKKAPESDSKKFEELQVGALGELLDQAWIRGQAEELDLSVTDKQVEDELAVVKKENFPTATAYQKFLEESNFTAEDVNDRIRLQLLTTQIQEAVSGKARKPSPAEIESYFEAEKATQFTTKASRDVRLILNKDKGEVEAAKAALEKDSSPANWKKVAGKYSSDPASSKNGGLQEGITEEFLQGPLKAAIFDSPTGELAGPVKFQENYVLVEVVKLTPEKVQTLAEAKTQIESTLGQEKQQEFFAEFVADFTTKWTERTFCADEFADVVEKCSNFKGDGHPANSSPACYEADPKTPAKECPAPVTPISPALPGTVTEAKPKGEPFPQRPLPEASGAGGAELPGGVPPAAAPAGE